MPTASPFAGHEPRILELHSDLIRAEFCSYGARLTALYLRNPDGSETNIALGFPQLDDYPAHDSYVGAICGRFANRIAQARFELDGTPIALSANEGPNQLHGGAEGFDRRHWDTLAFDYRSVTFALTSPDGDQGYPGTMKIQVTYRIIDEDRLQCLITATCDRPTVVNLTNHAYWNLSGDFSRSAADHLLQIDADEYLPVDEQLIPLPGRSSVEDTAFDFREEKSISERLDESGGYDHNFCLDGARGQLRPVARLTDPESGRSLSLSTTEAGLQFYLARHFSPALSSREGRPLHPAAGIALEPQTYPDSPNRPDFPSARLEPGEVYEHLIEWKFAPGPEPTL
ncbi:galactose mutarotase [Marinobacterium sp. D7]|uniref:aldose epimerase family protein n=1 Tax=Marinobacterium ramblicola TaxID=2849041 RepID=UPI001C2CD39C|nr:aldose epimerase family protein [Marinobacterium ramblicola]MBV1787634.1 galactose mutarotase [Marinobacterium ramblicola]